MTRSTARRKAKALGHILGRTVNMHDSRGLMIYGVAWCKLCGAACFVNQVWPTLVNPALDRSCSATLALDTGDP